MRNEMKVSIITVTYNVIETIEQTINSVLNQSYENIEYIIVDGMSTDGTWEKICQYKNRINSLVHEQDRGLYDALNKGILLATGEIVGIINGDDAIEYMLAGATAVSIGSGNFVDPETSIKTIEGIENYMRKHNIEDIKSIIGTVEMN